MKKQYPIITLLFVCLCQYSQAQVNCIYCYNQNNPVSTGVTNFILNGGFENNGNCTPGYILDVFCPNSTNYSCDIPNWICTGGGPSTYCCIFDNTANSRSAIPEGTKAAYLGNSFCQACSSTYNDISCLADSNCIVTGIPNGYPVNTPSYGGTTGVTISQTVSGLTPGNTYVLEFWAGGETNPPYFDYDGVFAANVGFGNIFLFDKPTPHIGGIGTRYIIEFNAISSSHQISFTNWGHVSDSCTELVLDDVQLYALDELSKSVPPCLAGINSVSDSLKTFTAYPNPFTNELTIITNSNEETEVILYDLTSRKLMQQQFVNSIKLNTEGLAKGIYYYEIVSENGSSGKGKVVKE